MTFREKLKLEHPEGVGAYFVGGCAGCPSDYGYEDEKYKDTCGLEKDTCGLELCEKCWDREIPGGESVFVLKSCPFCGGDAEFHNKSRSTSGDLLGYKFKIRCKECKAETPDTYSISFKLIPDGTLLTVEDDRLNALEFWNRSKTDCV